MGQVEVHILDVTVVESSMAGSSPCRQSAGARSSSHQVELTDDKHLPQLQGGGTHATLSSRCRDLVGWT